MPYRGRFAPSPTGELHFGSLLAALASCLEARSRGGEWLVRMEDVDAPRVVAGAAGSMLACLEAHGFVWDGETLWQSRRLDAYRAALDELRARGLAYGCACSRKEIAMSAKTRAIDGGLLYSGKCRHGTPSGRPPRAWRLRVENADIAFDDPIQGRVSQNLARDVGDFVLLRADGQFAYQLAVVVDDAFQGITHVARGADLLDSTPRQIYLQRCLGYAAPDYLHVPVATNMAGEKLSKQTGAKALNLNPPAANLTRALGFLGQCPPQELARASVGAVWEWALENWKREAIPRCRGLRTED